MQPTSAPSRPYYGTPVAGPPPRKRRRVWSLAVTAGAALILVGATAATTYALTRRPAPTPPSPLATGPQYTQAEQSAAKDRVCHVFDVATRGLGAHGAMRENGQLNVPVVVRALNGADAVRDTLDPAVPPQIAIAARKFISATLDQTTAALADTPAAEGNRLNDLTNNAIDDMAAVCGLG